MIGLAVGFLGSFLPEAMKMINGHLEHRQEVQLLKMNQEIWKDQNIADLERAIVEGQAAQNVAVQKSVQTEDRTRKSIWDTILGWDLPNWVQCFAVVIMVFVEMIRQLVRPLMTFALFAATFYLAFFAIENPLATEYATSITLAFEAIVAFWFGERSKRRGTASSPAANGVSISNASAEDSTSTSTSTTPRRVEGGR